jgi:hypothetical protein
MLLCPYSYTAGKKLKGIIWLHPINDVRFSKISKSNFKMFRNLCGDSTLVNVIIATTKWSKENLSAEVNREKELREQDDYLKPALEKEAKLVRHYNSQESAHQIIHSLFTNIPLPLQIQREMVEMRKPLGQTTAGAGLKLQLESDVKEFGAKLTDLDAQVDAAKKEGDTVTQRELEEEREATRKRFRNLQLEAEKLMVDRRRERFWWLVLCVVGIFIALLLFFRLRRTIDIQGEAIKLQEEFINEQADDIKQQKQFIMHQEHFIDNQSKEAQNAQRAARRFSNFLGVGGVALGYAIRAAQILF